MTAVRCRIAWLAASLALALAVAAPRPIGAQDAAAAFDLSKLDIPEGFLDLRDLVLTARPGGGVMATATTTLAGADTHVLIASAPSDGGRKRRMTVGLEPGDWSLTKTIPALENPVLDQLTLSHVGLVLTGEDLDVSSSDLSPEEYAFYRQIYRVDAFQLELEPGINLIAAVPLGNLEDGSPLAVAFDALGIQRTGILVQGTLGKSLSLIGKGVPGRDVVKDLLLRAELPEVRPPGSPAWFKSGQLALEITGDPSVRLVGDLTVDIDDDILDFFVAGRIAKTGMTLSGGLQSDEGWQQPFGIDWLILREAVLQLGITPAGSLQLGFGGDMVVGEKDIDVAVAVALNAATGVPTNFIFDGSSKTGFGLADLVELQTRMAAARKAAVDASGAGGSAEPPKIPLDRLPDVDFRDVKLKFAPKPDPDLGVERGMAIKGQMWLRTQPKGDMQKFAGVDVSVGEDGLWARGDLGAFSLGPLTWQDARLDLTATPDSQVFLIKGKADLLGSSQELDVHVSRTEFSFETDTRLFDLFTANLDAHAKFDLQRPAFTVDGVADNDFGDSVTPLLTERFAGVAQDGKAVLDETRQTIDALDAVLSNQEATVDQVRAAVEAQRTRARNRLQKAEAAAQDAYRRRVSTYRSYLAAYRSWRATPRRQVGLKARRRATMLRRRATFSAARRVHVARAAQAAARQRIYEALPSPEESRAVRAAEATASGLRQRLETSKQRLERLERIYDSLLAAQDAGTSPVTIRSARLHADLEHLVQGKAVHWEIEGSFAGEPFSVKRDLDFGDPEQVAADLVASLMTPWKAGP